MKQNLYINLVTRKDTTSTEFGRSFLELLTDRHPQLAPDIYDTRPERECINPFINIDSALPRWAFRGIIREVSDGVIIREIPTVLHNTLKKKNGNKYYVDINHTRTSCVNTHILGLLSFRAVPYNKFDWLGAFRDICILFEPVLARMHIFTDIESKNVRFKSPESMFMAGPCEPEMQDGLTNLGWANVFGEEFASEVDEERLRAQGFAVDPVPGGKLFTVTDNLFHVVNDFPKFSRRRAELKSLFRSDLFRIKGEPDLSGT